MWSLALVARPLTAIGALHRRVDSYHVDAKGTGAWYEQSYIRSTNEELLLQGSAKGQPTDEKERHHGVRHRKLCRPEFSGATGHI